MEKKTDPSTVISMPTGWSAAVVSSPEQVAAAIKQEVTSGGLKYDTGKPRMDLLPAYSLEQIALVLGVGAQKYSSWNWSKGIAYSRLLGACLRHLYAWARREKSDPESGLSHLAHAGCCILFLLWMEKNRQDLDDRGDS